MWKRTIFKLLAVVLFFWVAELVLMLAGVQPMSSTEDPYVGFSSAAPLFIRRPGADGRWTMATAENKLASFNPQQFPARKAPGTYRIFSLGGSTTYGRPYRDLTSFNGWLREFLLAADPSRHWEVINAGGISYASYRVAKLTEELIDYQPDLLIVYCGHNEFLEKRTYGRLAEMSPMAMRTWTLLGRSRTYSLLARLVRPVAGDDSQRVHQRHELAGEVDEILSHTVGPASYARDDELRLQVLAHYRFSLGRIARLARAVGAQVIFVTTPSNLKDCSPFKSQHRSDRTSEDQEKWSALLKQAQFLQIEGRHEEAMEHFRQAKALDDRFAELHYRMGKSLLALSRHEDAHVAFRHALEEDVCPLRALTPMRQIVREVAAENGADLVDFAAVLEDRSLRQRGHAILGDGDFLDHVHPNIDAHRLLALTLLEEMGRMGAASPREDWGPEAIATVTRQVMERIDTREYALALHNLAKVLNWGGKHKEAARLAREALRTVRDDPESVGSFLIVGADLEQQSRLGEALEEYRQAVALAPQDAQARRFLASALARLGKFDQAEPHYLAALQLAPQDPQVHLGLGQVRFQQGRFDEAVQHFQAATMGLSNNPDVRYNLALALDRAGRKDEAAVQYGVVLELNWRDAAAHNALGQILAEQSRLAEAATHYRNALQIQANFPEARANLQAVLEQQANATGKAP